MKAPHGSATDFLARIRFSLSESNEDQRPLALLLGSGVSLPHVPGVKKITMAIRRSLEESDHRDFDEYLAEASNPGERYERAFQFLSFRRPGTYRDRIIRHAVLSAYRPARKSEERLDDEELYRAEIDSDNWDIPPGLESIARIWAGLPKRLQGPIVTTNFDPLIEVALRRAGATATTHMIDGDGNAAQTPSLSETVDVIHIHGFWRQGETLSLMQQLSEERELLAHSLRSLLERHSTIVAGYAGWNDAATRSLQALVSRKSSGGLDVLWCAYGEAADLEEHISNNPSLNAISDSPSVQFYVGCDSNKLMPELESTIADYLVYSDESRESASVGTLIGYDLVRASDFTQDRDQKAQRSRALQFFDGREPSVRDAFNPFIARRDVVPTVVNQLQARGSSGQSTLTVLVGASGEGKSTALAQISAALSVADIGPVLVNREGVLKASEVLDMPSGKPSFIIIDEAQESIGQLKSLCASVNERSQENLHIVIAVRDTDWASVGGFNHAWGKYINFKAYRVKGLTQLDAEAIVSSWESLGASALGSLADISEHQDRVVELLSVAEHNSRDISSGTLFGLLWQSAMATGL